MNGPKNNNHNKLIINYLVSDYRDSISTIGIMIRYFGPSNIDYSMRTILVLVISLE